MKKNTSKLIIAFALTAIVAYSAGAFLQFPNTSGKAAGDVGRVKAYSANIVEIDSDNLQERLQSDSVFCSQLTCRAILMQTQANSLAEFIRKSNELLGGNDSLQVALDALNVSYQSVLNACNAIDKYVDNLAILSNGGKVKGFEQIYNNALLGYYLVNSKSDLVDSFKGTIGKYMSDSKDIFSQEQLDARYRFSQEQLGWRNQELLKRRNQEQLGWRNQEKLNNRNQEQLNQKSF